MHILQLFNSTTRNYNFIFYRIIYMILTPYNSYINISLTLYIVIFASVKCIATIKHWRRIIDSRIVNKIVHDIQNKSIALSKSIVLFDRPA